MEQTETKKKVLQFKFVWPITIVVLIVEVILLTFKDMSNPGSDELSSLFGFLLIVTGLIGAISFLFWLIWIVPKINLYSKKIVIPVCILLAVVGLWAFIGHPIEIMGTGINTSKPGAQYLLCKICKVYKRGDVIVYNHPKNQTVHWVGRLIGLPDETIQLEYGTLKVNSSVISEPYADWSQWPKNLSARTQLTSKEYLVMLDDRTDGSKEYFKNHKITDKDIIGVVGFKIWPLE